MLQLDVVIVSPLAYGPKEGLRASGGDCAI